MQKNVASQKWIVFAFQDEGGTNPGEPVTGDALNITANLYLDGSATPNAVDDVNPTELGGGYYAFDITAAESNAECIVIVPASATANVNVIGVPGVVYPTPANFPDLSVSASTGLVNLSDKTGFSISGTLTTLDALDTAQDTQHATTQADIAALNDPTAAAIADAVWDEPRSGHVAVGSTGETLTTVETNIDNLDAPISTVDANVDAILVDTGTTIPAQITALNDLDAAGVRSAVGLATANLDTQLAALPTAAENATAVLGTALTEPSAVPAWAGTIEDALNWLLAITRNKTTTTATTHTVRNDADTLSIASSTLSDDGTTMTRGEFA